MLCDVDGMQPWARYVSTTPSLMRWKLADRQFTRPIAVGGYDFTYVGDVPGSIFSVFLWLRRFLSFASLRENQPYTYCL